MTSRRNKRWLTAAVAVCLLRTASAQVGEQVKTLKVGDTAMDFEFQPIEGKNVKLSKLAENGPVVLVVLRGYPGYQCPLCSQQVRDLRQRAAEFAEIGATVVLVYPGPEDELRKRAREFLKGDVLPKPLLLVIDPAYRLTNLYGLRWDAAGETAYPSTFILDSHRKVRYAKVSRTHGDRAKTEELLELLAAMTFADTAKGREIPADE